MKDSEIRKKLLYVEETLKEIDDIDTLKNYGFIKEVDVYDELEYDNENRYTSIYIAEVINTKGKTLHAVMYSHVNSCVVDIDSITLKSLDGIESSYTYGYKILKWLK